MSRLSLIIFILIFFLLGFIFYKLKRREFTDNSIFILNLLFNELNGIYYKLNFDNISKHERKSLINRKKEIHKTLEQFFGKNLIEQENELV